VAVFEAQISTQVAETMKADISAMLAEDKAISSTAQVSEADVIREALGVGLVELLEITPADRVERYSRRRRGIA
jgi:hypothetical protein